SRPRAPRPAPPAPPAAPHDPTGPGRLTALALGPDGHTWPAHTRACPSRGPGRHGAPVSASGEAPSARLWVLVCLLGIRPGLGESDGWECARRLGGQFLVGLLP